MGLKKMFWFHLTTLLDFLKKHHVIMVKLIIFLSEAVLWQYIVSNYCKVTFYFS